MFADERHEHCRLERLSRESIVSGPDQSDDLAPPIADGHDQPTIGQELLHQRFAALAEEWASR